MALLLKVSDLRKLVGLAGEALRLEVGPMALVQRPATELLERAALKYATVNVGRPKVAAQAVSLIGHFEQMLVVPLGATGAEGVMTFGRAQDCDVEVQDPSTSQHHARVRWDAWKRAAWIADLGSTNGTWVNGRSVGTSELQLAEGDTVSLGDAAFFFVTVETLQAMLKSTPRS